MLRRILLSHSPVYFFVLPILCFLIVYSAYPTLNRDVVSFNAFLNPDFSFAGNSKLTTALFWFFPVVLTVLFLPMLSSRFAMFEKGMFLNGIFLLLMIPAFMFFSGNLNAVLASVIVLPVYYFIFGMYKSEFPVHLFFNASLVVSVASMIYLPAVVFIIVIWVGWLFYNPFKLRAFLISITGLLVPVIFVFSYFFLTDKIESIAIDKNLLNFESRKLNQNEIIFICFIIFFTFIGMIRLIAPGSVKKIGPRRNFNFSLFVFTVLVVAVFLTKDMSLLVFAFFPASVITNVSIAGATRGWTFLILLFLFLGSVLYFPFGIQIFG